MVSKQTCYVPYKNTLFQIPIVLTVRLFVQGYADDVQLLYEIQSNIIPTTKVLNNSHYAQQQAVCLKFLMQYLTIIKPQLFTRQLNTFVILL